LRPGQFGKVRTVIDHQQGALVIPQEAVNELQGNQIVGVVGNDNKVTMRPVEMGERAGAMWQVLEGLKAGEKVVVQGMMKVRPGMPVTVKDWIPPAEQTRRTPVPLWSAPSSSSSFGIICLRASAVM
jgi:membrane fusion protein (multidrug efflux system)